MQVLAVFLLVAHRRCFACSVSLHSTSLVSPHAWLLFCPFQFICFLLHAALLLFVLVAAFFVSRSFLFWPFLLFSSLPAFGCSSLWLVFLRFFGFAWFFRFFFQFFFSVAFAFSACFVQSLAVFISGLCYFSWRSV